MNPRRLTNFKYDKPKETHTKTHYQYNQTVERFFKKQEKSDSSHVRDLSVDFSAEALQDRSQWDYIF